jgi:hypothetical protein
MRAIRQATTQPEVAADAKSRIKKNVQSRRSSTSILPAGATHKQKGRPDSSGTSSQRRLPGGGRYRKYATWLGRGRGGMGQAAGGAAEGELPGEGVYSDECRTLVVVLWLVD